MGIVKKIGLTAKLTIAVVLSSVATYVVVLGLGYSLTNRVVLGTIDKFGEDVVESAVWKVDRIEDAVNRITTSAEFFLQHATSANRDTIFRLFEISLKNNPEISGISMSFEPYVMDPREKYFSPYCLRSATGTNCKLIGSATYDYFTLDWYNEAKTTGHAVWIDPYIDEDSGNAYILSHSAPFYRYTPAGNIFLGVVSADISQKWLQDTIASVAAGYGGYAFLIARDGRFITFPDEQFVLKRSLVDIARESGDEDLQKIAAAMTSGKTGISPFKDFTTGERSWIFYKPVQLSDWSIGIVFEEDKLLADIFFIVHRMILLGACGLLVLSAIVVVLARRITRPLLSLSSAASGIAHGNLDTPIPAVGRKDEVGALARAFASMQRDLKKYIGELTDTVARQERIGNELRIAHDIQQSIVPKEFPSFGVAGNVSAWGTLVPAREVGGDLYDCFEIDERHTFFVVGDVSDKGVHAALLMAIVSTLLRSLSKNLRDPDAMLGIVNRQILKRNRESMFVTLFCGILDNETGVFRYVNAGHVPPVLLRRGATPVLVAEDADMVLGINAQATYAWRTITLADGDTLFMYTDGVTDAVDAHGELFGEARLLDELARERAAAPEEIVAGVFEAVKHHAKNCPLPDDIALLCFSFAMCASSMKKSVQVPIANSVDELGRVAQALRAFGADCGCTEDAMNDVTLAVEEILTNIVRYAYDDANKHTIDIALEVVRDRFIVRIEDDGRPFDSSRVADPDTHLPVEERPLGGLGVFLAKKLTDKLYYERLDDHNRLTLVKIIEENSHAKC